MSDISSIIEVYRMTELRPITRANIMIRLGNAINDANSMNLTGDLVGELLLTLPVNREDLVNPSWLPVRKEVK
jgi:hypothetical protein